jgi:hypothetical protein
MVQVLWKKEGLESKHTSLPIARTNASNILLLQTSLRCSIMSDLKASFALKLVFYYFLSSHWGGGSKFKTSRSTLMDVVGTEQSETLGIKVRVRVRVRVR